MATWLWGSSQPAAAAGSAAGGSGVGGGQRGFQTLLDKLTSPLLPTAQPTDLAQSLELADMIRAKEVTPQFAAAAFGKKITSTTNPNVHLRAMSVLDFAVKNGGDGFIHAVSQRAPGASKSAGETVVDGLEKLAGSAETKREVLNALLSHLQNWALSIQSMSHLNTQNPYASSTKPLPDLVLLYRELKNRGLPFPKPDTTSVAAMVESMSMPEWTESDRCSYCQSPFTFLNRRHHCRNCGQIFDQQCSSKTLPLPHFGVTREERVCDGCYRNLKAGKTPRRNSISSDATTSPNLDEWSAPSRSQSVSSNRNTSHKYSQSHSSMPNNAKVRGPSSRAQEEADLARAIQMSLAETGNGEAPNTTSDYSRSGYAPRSSPYNPNYISSAPPSQPPAEARIDPKDLAEAENDPDLKAALEASLRDLETSRPSAPSAPPARQEDSGWERTNAGDYRPKVPRLPSYDLAPADSAELAAFSRAVDDAQAAGRDPRELWPMLQRTAAIATQLDKGVDVSGRKRQMLDEMNTKLSNAVQLYDQKLQERYASQQYGQYGYSQPPQTYAQPASAPQQYSAPSASAPPQAQYASAYPNLQNLSIASPPPQQVYSPSPYSASEPNPSAPSGYAPAAPPPQAAYPQQQPSYQPNPADQNPQQSYYPQAYPQQPAPQQENAQEYPQQPQQYEHQQAPQISGMPYGLATPGSEPYRNDPMAAAAPPQTPYQTHPQNQPYASPNMAQAPSSGQGQGQRLNAYQQVFQQAPPTPTPAGTNEGSSRLFQQASQQPQQGYAPQSVPQQGYAASPQHQQQDYGSAPPSLQPQPLSAPASGQIHQAYPGQPLPHQYEQQPPQAQAPAQEQARQFVQSPGPMTPAALPVNGFSAPTASAPQASSIATSPPPVQQQPPVSHQPTFQKHQQQHVATTIDALSHLPSAPRGGIWDPNAPNAGYGQPYGQQAPSQPEREVALIEF